MLRRRWPTSRIWEQTITCWNGSSQLNEPYFPFQSKTWIWYGILSILCNSPVGLHQRFRPELECFSVNGRWWRLWRSGWRSEQASAHVFSMQNLCFFWEAAYIIYIWLSFDICHLIIIIDWSGQWHKINKCSNWFLCHLKPKNSQCLNEHKTNKGIGLKTKVMLFQKN